MPQFLSLSEAVATYVRDGMTVALEGFTHLIPFAAGHEIIRQRKRDLTLIRMTPDLICDQLIGMGCVRKLIFSWGGNPGVGSLHRLRDAVENGWPCPLEVEEHSHAAMANAYHAGAAGLPARSCVATLAPTWWAPTRTFGLLPARSQGNNSPLCLRSNLIWRLSTPSAPTARAIS